MKALSTVQGAFPGPGDDFKGANATDHDPTADPQNQECSLFVATLVPRAIFQFKVGVARLHGDLIDDRTGNLG
jgi:hypothetical protein